MIPNIVASVSSVEMKSGSCYVLCCAFSINAFGQAIGDALPPHVFSTAKFALGALQSGRQNQSVVIRYPEHKNFIHVIVHL